MAHTVHIERVENIHLLCAIRKHARTQTARHRCERDGTIRRTVAAWVLLSRGKSLCMADNAAAPQHHFRGADPQHRRDHLPLDELRIVIAHITALSTQKTPSLDGQRYAALLAGSIHLSPREEDTHLLRTLHRILPPIKSVRITLVLIDSNIQLHKLAAQVHLHDEVLTVADLYLKVTADRQRRCRNIDIETESRNIRRRICRQHVAQF